MFLFLHDESIERICLKMSDSGYFNLKVVLMHIKAPVFIFPPQNQQAAPRLRCAQARVKRLSRLRERCHVAPRRRAPTWIRQSSRPLQASWRAPRPAGIVKKAAVTQSAAAVAAAAVVAAVA